MSKSLHSSNNKIFLKKLKDLRKARQLRQADLARLLGRSQGTVSNVERGETTLDIIELREWLDALNYKFMRFLKELDAELQRPETHLRGGTGRSHPASAARSHIQTTGQPAIKATPASAPAKACKPRTRP